jgi:hypothetical protein
MAFACFMLVLATVGCETKSSLHGNVTYNGKPVASGSIMFRASDGEGPGFSAEVRDGTYHTDQPRLGEHIAIVRGLEMLKMASKGDAIQQREANDNPYNMPTDYIPEDAKGNSSTVDIEGGDQSLDFTLEGPQPGSTG